MHCIRSGDNVEKLCKVLQATSKWKKKRCYHKTFQGNLRFLSCEFFTMNHDDVFKELSWAFSFHLFQWHFFHRCVYFHFKLSKRAVKIYSSCFKPRAMNFHECQKNWYIIKSNLHSHWTCYKFYKNHLVIIDNGY